MRVSRVVALRVIVLRVLLTVALACLASFALSQQAQQSDQAIAERVLGPQWKQLSRRAGMIFAGTLLASADQTVTSQNMTTQTAANKTAATARSVPEPTPMVQTVQLSFRVDHAIAGVGPGQVLTIHEWSGASSMHRPMIKGQHILLFLYPPSRLGLTSPVGGSLGQIALDSSGENVAAHPSAARVGQSEAFASQSIAPQSFAPQPKPASAHTVSILQLERAIRSARIGEE